MTLNDLEDSEQILWDYSLHVRKNPTPWPLNFLDSRVPNPEQGSLTKTGANPKN